MKETKVTVKIPRPLYRKIQLVIESSGFNSPTDFIVFVLRDLVGEWDASQKIGAEDEVFSADEIRAVKEKLRNLGYL